MSKSQLPHSHHHDALQILDALRKDVGACCVFLISVMGNTVLSSGEQETLPMDEINALLGGSISALVQAGKTLDDKQHDFNLVYQREGSRHHLFSINVGENLLMTLLIPKTQFGTPLGAIMHYSQRVARQLGEMLKDVELASPAPELPEDASAAVAEDLDALFAHTDAIADDAIFETGNTAHYTFTGTDSKGNPLLTYEDAVRQGLLAEQQHHATKGEPQNEGGIPG